MKFTVQSTCSSSAVLLLILASQNKNVAAQCRFRNEPSLCFGLMNAPENAVSVQRDIDAGNCPCFNFCNGRYVNDLVSATSSVRCAMVFSGLSNQCGIGGLGGVVSGCVAADKSNVGSGGPDRGGATAPVLPPGRFVGPITVSTPTPPSGGATGPGPTVIILPPAPTPPTPPSGGATTPTPPTPPSGGATAPTPTGLPPGRLVGPLTIDVTVNNNNGPTAPTSPAAGGATAPTTMASSESKSHSGDAARTSQQAVSSKSLESSAVWSMAWFFSGTVLLVVALPALFL